MEFLNQIYEMAMLILFRVLFIAYAEDKDLLPYKSNDLYKKRSLKNLVLELKKLSEKKELSKLGNSCVYWDSIKHIFSAINYGNKNWGIPPYNGGLFSNNNSLLYANELDKLSIKDKFVGKALSTLLLMELEDGLGPVDFRSLGVREFGSIYEGLLEVKLNYANKNLSVMPDGNIKAVTKKTTENIIEKGTLYLANNSGKRKITGSYFTKSFIVDNLLKNSLNPALDLHLANLDKLNEDDAAEKFFDFKIADISMGSGHFLVSAIDYVEIKLSNYLTKRKLPKILSQLLELRNNVTFNLGDLSKTIEIEDSQLLRRIIARKFIYGVDINPVSVQLARLAVWIHTFVPGLPLSFLDHNLVEGNSLVGIGKLDEIKDKLIEGQEGLGDLFSKDPSKILKKSIEPLKKLSEISDGNLKDIKKAEQAHLEANQNIKHVKILCDIISTARVKKDVLRVDLTRLEEDLKTLGDSSLHKKYQNDIEKLNPFHFPISFPEVFIRENPGFDVIIGNPPWEEVTIEEDSFWARYFPGLGGLSQSAQEEEKELLKKQWPNLSLEYEKDKKIKKSMRQALMSGEFPGMGTGDPDYYKAFCWRFWQLIEKKNGRIGIILPRSTFVTEGSSEFRNKIFTNNDVDIVTLKNQKNWVFDDVGSQQCFALTVIENKKERDSVIRTAGHIYSLKEFNKFNSSKFANFKFSDIKNISEFSIIPQVPSNISSQIINKMRLSKRFDYFNMRPNSELHATNDKKLMNLSSKQRPKNHFPIYKGESFNQWQPDMGLNSYYAWGNPKIIEKRLFEKRINSFERKGSVYNNFTRSYINKKTTLDYNKYRIVFRDIARSTDARTIIASLIPPKVFLTNKAPYLIFYKDDHLQMSYILAIMNSLVFDWWARRFIEMGVNFYLLNFFPIPKVNENNKLFRRITHLSAKLCCVDQRFKEWAKLFNVDVCHLKDSEKNENICEIDAISAALYNLSEEELINIYKTFHKQWDYSFQLDKTLKYFRKIK